MLPLDAAVPPRPRTAAATQAVVRSPFAFSLVSVLLITTIWTRLHPADATGAYLWVSTNIHNMLTVPVRSLVLSALFLPDQRWLVNAILLMAVAVPLERRIGSLRTVAVFASAHVIGTVLTEGYEWLAVHAGVLPQSVVFQEDVGVSYGLYGMAAAACALLPRSRRGIAVGLVGLYVAVPLAVDPGMTTAGHVICWAIGLAWWPYLLGKRPGDLRWLPRPGEHARRKRSVGEHDPRQALAEVGQPG